MLSHLLGINTRRFGVKALKKDFIIYKLSSKVRKKFWNAVIEILKIKTYCLGAQVCELVFEVQTGLAFLVLPWHPDTFSESQPYVA